MLEPIRVPGLRRKVFEFSFGLRMSWSVYPSAWWPELIRAIYLSMALRNLRIILIKPHIVGCARPTGGVEDDHEPKVASPETNAGPTSFSLR